VNKYLSTTKKVTGGKMCEWKHTRWPRGQKKILIKPNGVEGRGKPHCQTITGTATGEKLETNLGGNQKKKKQGGGKWGLGVVGRKKKQQADRTPLEG